MVTAAVTPISEEPSYSLGYEQTVTGVTGDSNLSRGVDTSVLNNLLPLERIEKLVKSGKLSIAEVQEVVRLIHDGQLKEAAKIMRD